MTHNKMSYGNEDTPKIIQVVDQSTEGEQEKNEDLKVVQ